MNPDAFLSSDSNLTVILTMRTQSTTSYACVRICVRIFVRIILDDSWDYITDAYACARIVRSRAHAKIRYKIPVHSLSAARCGEPLKTTVRSSLCDSRCQSASTSNNSILQSRVASPTRLILQSAFAKMSEKASHFDFCFVLRPLFSIPLN